MRKSWKIIAVAAVSVLAVTATGVPILNYMAGSTVAAAEPVWSEPDVESEYSFGSEFTLPQRTVTVGDQTAEATAVLEFPDGSATKKETVTLDQSGIYTLSWSARVDGKAYLETDSFKVDDTMYTLNSVNSSASYGSYVTEHDGTEHANKPGLMVRLAEGDTLTFNQAIDVSDVTMNDVLVEAFVTPDVVGQADFRRLYFTFTDVENPDVYMRISARQSAEGDNYPATYYLAAGNSQPLTGYEAVWDRLHIDNEWGAQAMHSFSLQFGGNGTQWQEPETMPMSLRYDVSTLAVYTGGMMIIDFDNPSYFNTLWRGFPSGKVRLSISAAMYNSESANFCITEVRGIDLTAEKFMDTEAPEISVDSGYDTMPEAEAGRAYSVPGATAKDIYSGQCEVRTSVWYNYTSENAVMMDITDGKFVPERAGEYAIVYEAQDRQGNLAREILWVHAVTSVAEPVISLTGTPDQEITVGDLIERVDYETESFSGNSSVAVTASLGGETFEVGEEGFRPEKAGEYTVTYTVTDYIGQTGSVSYTVKAVLGTVPVFVDTPVLPYFFVSGSEYILPEVYANDYRSGKLERKIASAEITDASGTRTVQAGETFVPSVAENGDQVKVVFRCDGAETTVLVPAIQAWMEDAQSGRPRLQIENYLYSAGNDVSYAKSNESIAVTALQADGGWVFANDMLAYDFSLELKGVAGKTNYSGLRITFFDAENPACAIMAELVNSGSKTEIKIGGLTVGLSGSLMTGSSYTVGYDDGYITVNGTEVCQVTETVSGTPFDGFASGRLYVGISFSGAAEGAAYELRSVNGHTMNNSTTDRVSPKIVVYGDHGGSFRIGDVVTLPAAAACDTVDPNVSITMTVTDGSGQVLSDVDGLLLQNVVPDREYRVKLENYGQYTVVISAEDTFNQRANSRKYTYALNVDDDSAPIIEFNGEFQTEAKVGEAIVIPGFTVSDNISEAENIIVTKYVLTPNGVLVTIPEASNSLIAANVGEYEFRIIAMDEAGNITMIRKTVTVTEAEGGKTE